MANEIEGDKYCLGNGERACDGCGQENNWQLLNEMPNAWRLEKQKQMTRIDDIACILNGRPWRL